MKNNLFIRVISKETDENDAHIIKTVHLFYAHGVMFGIDERYSWQRTLILDIDTPNGMERVTETINSDDEVIVDSL